MIKKFSLFVLGCFSLFVLSGCFATQDDVSVLKTQVAALNKTLQDLQKNQASTGSQMEELTIQLTQSGENLKDFDYKLDDLSSKLDNIVSILNKESVSMLPTDIFAEAQKQFKAGRCEQAIKGYSLYIKDAPEGQNIQEAYLNTAICQYNLKEYQKAAVSSATLLDKFPSSSYTAQARVLYAQSILPLNKKDEAKTYLKSVVQDFKNTKEATEAKNLLEGIK